MTSGRLGIQTRRPLPTCRGPLPRPRLRATARRAPVLHPGAGPVVAGDAEQLPVDRGALLDEAGRRVDVGVGEQVEEPLADDDVLVERHRPLLLDDRGGVAAHGLQPLPELLRVRDRRGEGDQRHRLRKVDDHLLPHRSAGPVGEVVDLVHHHEAEALQRPGPGVQHVAEDLGRHHDDRGIAVDDVVAGQQADPVVAVARDEVVVLLVRQGLDRGRVERLAAGLEREVDGELAHDRLAGAGRRRHQDSAPVLDLPAGAHLEVVEREGVEALEGPQHRVAAGQAEVGVRLRRGEIVRGGHDTTLGPAPGCPQTSTVRAPGAHSMVSGRGANRSPSA